MLLAMLLCASAAAAHVNDKGLDYAPYKDHRGVSCCNHMDCQPATDFVDTVENGYPVVRLLINGIWITVPRNFVVAEDAKDGRAHWCGRMVSSAGGSIRRAPVTLCVILPPRDT